MNRVLNLFYVFIKILNAIRRTILPDRLSQSQAVASNIMFFCSGLNSCE